MCKFVQLKLMSYRKSAALCILFLITIGYRENQEIPAEYTVTFDNMTKQFDYPIWQYLFLRLKILRKLQLAVIHCVVLFVQTVSRNALTGLPVRMIQEVCQSDWEKL